MGYINPKPTKHVLICVNEREEGDHCVKVGGQEVFAAVKSFIRENGLAGQIWVTRTKCLGFCNPIGTTVVIYPEGKWITKVTKEDVPELLQQITG